AKVKEELILYGAISLLLIYLASIGIYYFEKDAQPEAFSSIVASMWWAIATLTTVGYGDAYPVTMGGRLFTFVILMLGLGFVSVPSALLAASLSEEFKTVDDEEQTAEE
ncbi:MAG: potassium channel family protein, partial [Aggregatilineales bacterium]